MSARSATLPEVPSLENLRCFQAAAQTTTFRGAAKLVALTPAALGQRIRQLEDQIGAPLFERTTRSVALTGAGLALLPAARAALQAAAACFAAARGETAPPELELTIGTRVELGLSWLVPSHRALSKACPGLVLHYFFGSGPELLSRVRTRDLDCAVTSVRFTDPVLASLPLHREDYVLVAARALLRRTPLTLKQHARHHVLIDVDGSLPLYRYWQDGAEGEELTFARIWRVGAAAAMHELIRAGEGVGVLPRYMVKDELARGRLVVVFPTIKPTFDHFRLLFRRDDPRQSAFADLATAMRALPLR